MTRPAPTSSAFSTSPRATRTAAPCFDVVTPHRRSLLHAAHRRRRRAHASKTSASCSLAGADKVSINTAAVTDRAFVHEAAEKFGDQCIVVAIDAKRVSRPGEADRWEIFTHGGRKPTGPRRGRLCPRGGRARRGRNPAHLDGSRRHQARASISRSPAPSPTPCSVPVIASGGVGTLDHLVEGIRDGHATAVLAASIFHFGTYTVRAGQAHMARLAFRCGSTDLTPMPVAGEVLWSRNFHGRLHPRKSSNDAA